MIIMHVTIKKHKKMPVYSKKQSQIKAQSRAQVGALIFDKTSTTILAKFSDYSNIFSMECKAEFLEYTGMNDHAIKLEEDKQLLFSLIYSLKLVELKTLKTYIKTKLAIGFI